MCIRDRADDALHVGNGRTIAFAQVGGWKVDDDGDLLLQVVIGNDLVKEHEVNVRRGAVFEA